MPRVCLAIVLLLAACSTLTPRTEASCLMTEKRHDGPDGLHFCYPATLDLKVDGDEVTLTDNRDPRNLFGFKIVVRREPLAEGQRLADVVDKLLSRIRQGAAKRDHQLVRRNTSTAIGAPGEEAVLRYTLDAARVDYTDPDGHARSVGDEAMPIEVRLVAGERKGAVVVAWLVSDVARVTENGKLFEAVVRTLGE